MKFRRFSSLFVRQSGTTDCGLACLSMVFRHQGRTDPKSLLNTSPGRMLSLLELREIAKANGLEAKCVEMDISFLRALDKPCILHLQDGEDAHFQVFFPTRQKRGNDRVLVADPARYFYFCKLSDLEKRWPSKAALFFPNLATDPPRRGSLFGNQAIRRLLTGLPWQVVPLLQLVVTVSGLCLVGFLEKLSYSTLDPDTTKFMKLLGLAIVLAAGREVFDFTGQRFFHKISRELVDRLINRYLIICRAPASNQHGLPLKRTFTDIQKISLGMDVLLNNLIPNSVMMLIYLTVQFFLVPPAAVFTLLVTVLLFVCSYSHACCAAYDLAHLDQLKGKLDNLWVKIGPECTESGNYTTIQSSMTALLDDHQAGAQRHSRWFLLVRLFAGSVMLITALVVVIYLSTFRLGPQGALWCLSAGFLGSITLIRLFRGVFPVMQALETFEQNDRHCYQEEIIPLDQTHN